MTASPGGSTGAGQVYACPLVHGTTSSTLRPHVYLGSGDHEHLIHLQHGAFLELDGLAGSTT